MSETTTFMVSGFCIGEQLRNPLRAELASRRIAQQCPVRAIIASKSGDTRFSCIASCIKNSNGAIVDVSPAGTICLQSVVDSYPDNWDVHINDGLTVSQVLDK